MDIHIDWDGPYSLPTLRTLVGPTDYGVYQIYGSHPVYGSDKLLYIGKAAQQTFGIRIQQEEWFVNQDRERLNIYVGRLCGAQTPTLETWLKQIDWAERLLIYAHGPAYNSAGLNTLPEESVWDIHLFNWENYRDLLPEVSGARWTSKYDEFPNYGPYLR